MKLCHDIQLLPMLSPSLLPQAPKKYAFGEEGDFDLLVVPNPIDGGRAGEDILPHMGHLMEYMPTCPRGHQIYTDVGFSCPLAAMATPFSAPDSLPIDTDVARAELTMAYRASHRSFMHLHRLLPSPSSPCVSLTAESHVWMENRSGLALLTTHWAVTAYAGVIVVVRVSRDEAPDLCYECVEGTSSADWRP